MSISILVLLLTLINITVQKCSASDVVPLSCDNSVPLNDTVRKYIITFWLKYEFKDKKPFPLNMGCRGYFPENIPYRTTLWEGVDIAHSYTCHEDVWDLYSVFVNKNENRALIWVCNDKYSRGQMNESSYSNNFKLIDQQITFNQAGLSSFPKFKKFLLKEKLNSDKMVFNVTYQRELPQSKFCPQLLCSNLKIENLKNTTQGKSAKFYVLIGITLVLYYGGLFSLLCIVIFWKIE